MALTVTDEDDDKPLRVFQRQLTEVVWSKAHLAGVGEFGVSVIVATLLKVLTNLLADGCVVTLPGFGTFATTDRPARLARDVRTGKPITIPARRQVTFRAGKDLRQALRRTDDSFGK